MTSDELDDILIQATNYDWKEGDKYFIGPIIKGKGLDVTKSILKARKKLFTFYKETHHETIRITT